ncbi:MAG: biliverdin-producing heme oxygenase [Pseudomonadota bacterium]
MTLAVDNRHVLKAATKSAHQRAEARWVTEGRFADRAAYSAWLAAMAGVHVTLGAPAARLLNDPSWRNEERQRLAALKADLSADLPECDTSPERSGSWAWGVAYALNGSAMGASILLKSGAVASGWPRRYLTVLRAYATSGRLHGFFAELAHQGIDLDEAGTGAKDVFAALAQARH